MFQKFCFHFGFALPVSDHSGNFYIYPASLRKLCLFPCTYGYELLRPNVHNNNKSPISELSNAEERRKTFKRSGKKIEL